MIVPGNHDIPLYNIWQRFFFPLKRFHHFIKGDEEPDYFDDEITIVGINTARSLTFKEGKISKKQIIETQKIIAQAPLSSVKIVATHHPVRALDSGALEKLIEVGAQVFISGHWHKSASEQIVRQLQGRGHSALLVHAGTATSLRYRNESNSFNVVTINGSNVLVEPYIWDVSKQGFIGGGAKGYQVS